MYTQKNIASYVHGLLSIDKSAPMLNQLEYVYGFKDQLTNYTDKEKFVAFMGFMEQVQKAVAICDSRSRNARSHVETISLESTSESACSVEALYFVRGLTKEKGLHWSLDIDNDKSLIISVASLPVLALTQDVLQALGVLDDQNVADKLMFFSI